MTLRPIAASLVRLGLGPFLAPALLLLAAAAPAQPPEPTSSGGRGPGEDAAPEEQFAETVDVQVVNVEVRVTDRKGRPVTGLTQEDFELYEDGRRVEIEYFAENRAGPEEGGGAQAEPQESAQAAGRDLPVDALPPPGLRHFVVFLDLDHLAPGGLRKVLPDLESFTGEVLGPEDRVMVVVHQGNLRVALEFTEDAERVVETLGEVSRTAPGGIQRVTELRQAFRSVSFALSEDGDSRSCTVEESYRAEDAVREYAGWVGNRVEGTVSALTSLVRALVGLPGPKVILYVGEGLEQRPAAALFQLLVERCPVREQELQTHLMTYDLSASFQRLTADANANRVTFYTLDAGGLRSDVSVETEVGGLRLSTIGRRMRTANLQHTLFLMADETGGRAVFNANRFGEELEEIVRDVETYYSLGFLPEHQGDGRIHRLRVRVLADHHDARYRVAYRDKPLEERLVEAMLGTLLFGVESNPLGVELELGEATAGPGSTLGVPVRIRVPLRDVVVTQGAGFSVGRLRLVLATLDPAGEWSPVKQHEALFKLPEGEDPAGAVRQFEVAMDLPPGENTVAVGIRDEVGGETSYLRRTFQVADRTRISGTD